MAVDVLDSPELIELSSDEEPKEELELKEELKEEPVMQEVYLEKKGFDIGADW